jgi:hypothetical protein
MLSERSRGFVFTDSCRFSDADVYFPQRRLKKRNASCYDRRRDPREPRAHPPLVSSPCPLTSGLSIHYCRPRLLRPSLSPPLVSAAALQDPFAARGGAVRAQLGNSVASGGLPQRAARRPSCLALSPGLVLSAGMGAPIPRGCGRALHALCLSHRRRNRSRRRARTNTRRQDSGSAHMPQQSERTPVSSGAGRNVQILQIGAGARPRVRDLPADLR